MMLFDDLPSELLVHTFSFLSHRDILLRCALVSKAWNEISQDNVLWKLMARKLLPKGIQFEQQQHSVSWLKLLKHEFSLHIRWPCHLTFRNAHFVVVPSHWPCLQLECETCGPKTRDFYFTEWPSSKQLEDENKEVYAYVGGVRKHFKRALFGQPIPNWIDLTVMCYVSLHRVVLAPDGEMLIQHCGFNRKRNQVLIPLLDEQREKRWTNHATEHENRSRRGGRSTTHSKAIWDNEQRTCQTEQC